MKYEIIEADEKTVIGISDRIKNDENMILKIKSMWNAFCDEKGHGIIENIKGRVNGNTVAVYFNYSNENGFEYTNLIGCEVDEENTESLKGLTKIQIPKGRYAKFTIFGNPGTAVSKFWQNFWDYFGGQGEKLERTYTYDFEEYIAGNDYNNMEINIYIAVK